MSRPRKRTGSFKTGLSTVCLSAHTGGVAQRSPLCIGPDGLDLVTDYHRHLGTTAGRFS